MRTKVKTFIYQGGLRYYFSKNNFPPPLRAKPRNTSASGGQIPPLLTTLPQKRHTCPPLVEVARSDGGG